MHIDDASPGSVTHPTVDPKSDAGTPSDASVTDAAVVPTDSGTNTDASNPELDAAPPEDSGSNGDSGPADSGTDHDAGIDSGTDLDAEIDAATDAEIDAAIDAGTDPEDAATDSGTDATVDAGPICSGPPGLYRDDHCQVLGDGIRAYRPQYPLWSDGATKERFIYLPPGTKIDTSNPDRWNFPTGTRMYKMFSWNGTRVETRVLVKTGTAASFASWTLTSYAWSADQTSVSPASTSGVSNALGTPLDIPSQSQCQSCHKMRGLEADAVIGFNAIQLNHDDDGVTLGTLLDAGLLKNGSSSSLNVSRQNAVIPGDALAKAALGYLHGNCGHCHGGSSPPVGQALWSKVGITDLSDEPIFQTAVCHCLQNWTGRSNADDDPYKLRVAPAHEALSGIIGRMSRRGAGEQMPPIGTKVVDPTGLAAVRAWIDSMDDSACDATSPSICQ
jgi:mono/diheme cytochrome c family protein